MPYGTLFDGCKIPQGETKSEKPVYTPNGHQRQAYAILLPTADESRALMGIVGYNDPKLRKTGTQSGVDPEHAVRLYVGRYNPRIDRLVLDALKKREGGLSRVVCPIPQLIDQEGRLVAEDDPHFFFVEHMFAHDLAQMRGTDPERCLPLARSLLYGRQKAFDARR